MRVWDRNGLKLDSICYAKPNIIYTCLQSLILTLSCPSLLVSLLPLLHPSLSPSSVLYFYLSHCLTSYLIPSLPHSITPFLPPSISLFYRYGIFDGSESYVVLYKYKQRNTDAFLIYFWLGDASTTNEKGAAALLTVELDDAMGGNPVQVRILQGKEPAHFRSLFKGKMVTHRDLVTPRDTFLFHVKGTTAANTGAAEVNLSAESLNSDDAFVLVTKEKVNNSSYFYFRLFYKLLFSSSSYYLVILN